MTHRFPLMIPVSPHDPIKDRETLCTPPLPLPFIGVASTRRVSFFRGDGRIYKPVASPQKSRRDPGGATTRRHLQAQGQTNYNPARFNLQQTPSLPFPFAHHVHVSNCNTNLSKLTITLHLTTRL